MSWFVKGCIKKVIRNRAYLSSTFFWFPVASRKYIWVFGKGIFEKVSQNEPWNLQRHPCGTGSRKVFQKGAKRSKTRSPKKLDKSTSVNFTPTQFSKCYVLLK